MKIDSPVPTLGTRCEPPLIGVLANTDHSDEIAAQTIDEKYLLAAITGAGATPIIIPTLLSEEHLSRLINLVDGIILTGDASNIDPGLYRACGTVESHGPFDKKRDTVALWLITQALQQNIPILGICRGMQEMNVALGGTLQTGIVDNEQFSEHSGIDYGLAADLRYAHSHNVSLSRQGLLKEILGQEVIGVNSLHEQAVAELGRDLVVNATSADNIVEAFHHPGKDFFLGVQWHVEYALKNDPVSVAILAAFTRAINASQRQTIAA
ncbi:gamma-glutamyl-gamma-aminobutyrate hydrolase ['Osedax' symbiont bacterium Rs2_46_30_T18]|nr:gamma-glutamyl-gamma-aminobutyrate hydrolase ['Osedax' symbiont bacterium Rs2_46_30_T18]